MTDGGFTLTATEDLGGGMKVSATQAVAVKGHSSAASAYADGGALEISGDFGALKVGQACASKALGEANLGGSYGWAHAIGSGTDCTANWKYGLYTAPTFVQGLTVAARISQIADGNNPSVEGFSFGENRAQIRLAYANGPMSVAYYAKSAEAEFHGSYDLGVAKVSYGADTKVVSGDKRSELGVSAPFGALTLSMGYGKKGTLKGTSVGAKYALSKRTSVDMTYGSFTNAVDATGAAVESASRVRLLHTF